MPQSGRTPHWLVARARRLSELRSYTHAIHCSTVERINRMHPENEISCKLLRQIDQEPSASQHSLTTRLGVSVGKVNCCLSTLLDNCGVKANNTRSSQNKSAHAYLLTP